MAKWLNRFFIQGAFLLLLCAIAITANADDIPPTLEKRLLFFTHYVATGVHTYTPDTASAISPKIMLFTVGSEKTALRQFLEKQAAYIVQEGISSTFIPTASSFRATRLTGAASGFKTSLSGKRTAKVAFDGEEFTTNDILRVELYVTERDVTSENPFGLSLTRYDEETLE